MKTYALLLGHGPGWDDRHGIREQAGWTEHAEFMDSLVADGFIVVGGPLDSGAQTLHLVQAESETEIRARMATDPWSESGLLVVDSLQVWALWLDGR